MSGDLTILAKLQTQQQTLIVPLSRTVGELTEMLKESFHLETCKIVGLVKGKLPEQDVKLHTLHPSGATVKLMLIGVPRATLAAMGEQESVYEAQRLEDAQRQANEARIRAAAEARAREEKAKWEAEESVRRAQREEQRRVDQAAWEVRRREEEAAQRERERKAEQDVRNTFSIELQAFHNPMLDVSQKLLLPPQALQDLVNAKVQFPLTFQLLKPESVAAVSAETAAAAQAAHHAAASSTAAAAASSSSNEETKMDTSGSFSLAASSSAYGEEGVDPTTVPILSALVAYCAVQDFTAPPSTVSVPASLLRALNVNDGAKLRLTTVNLQKASHITLQPLTSAWIKLPELERRALLEFQLRKHTFLVQDSLLSFTYHPHMPSFTFRVVETKPDPVVSITDADLATEILPYEDASTAMTDDSQVAAAASSSSSSAASAAGPPKEIPKLTEGDSIQGKLTKEATVRFLYDVTDPNHAVTIDVKCISGDIDLYVLNTNQSESEVGLAHFTWCLQSKGSKTLTLSAREASFQTGTWEILLRAYGGEGEFSVVVKEAQANEMPGGHALSSGSGSSSTSAAAAPPADSILCSNCKQFISSRAMSMHSLQCARLNWCCDRCGLVVKTNEKQKHIDLVHSQYTCLCGVALDQPSLVAHKRDACSLRLTSCLYCPMKLVVAERGSHQAECGLLSSACPLCAHSIQRKVMRRHLIKTHGGINGKTDEREITYSDFWQ